MTVVLLLLRRALTAIPILLTVSILLFVALRLLPVDPAAMSMPPNATIENIETKRREMGLDKPLPTQYAIWLRDVLHGDFGRSIQLRRDAAQLVATSLPATIQLALFAAIEEVDYVPAASTALLNFGWRVYEGTLCTGLDAALCNPANYLPPVFEYVTHQSGRCSVTGGYVYRGVQSVLPGGTYVYGDFCSGEILAWDAGRALPFFELQKRLGRREPDLFRENAQDLGRGSIDASSANYFTRPPATHYRITSKSVGPRNSITFVQTLIRTQ
jgi:hypothetical protein